MDFAPYQDAPETQRVVSGGSTHNNATSATGGNGSVSPPLRSPPLRSPPLRSPPPRSPPSFAKPVRTASAIGTSALHSPSPVGGMGMGRSGSGSYFPPTHATDLESGNANGWNGLRVGGGAGAREDMDLFETRLGLRMDYEACLAYLLLPPAGGVLLLVLEHRSDYVRFHAWQSSLLFAFLFVVHVILSWSSFLSWTLLLCDLCLIGYLTFRAYRDASTLDRCEVPFFGPLASSILDDE